MFNYILNEFRKRPVVRNHSKLAKQWTSFSFMCGGTEYETSLVPCIHRGMKDIVQCVVLMKTQCTPKDCVKIKGSF